MTLGYVKVIFMRTGKHQFNYRAYAVEWAVKILANVKGYTLDKAYSIDRVFGAMVEDQVNAYKREYERVQRFAVVCGVYDKMIGDFKGFENNLRDSLEYFQKHKMDLLTQWRAEFNDEVGVDYYEVDPNVLACNKAIRTRLTSIVDKCEGLAEDKFNQLPVGLGEDFKALKGIGLELVESIDSVTYDLGGAVAALKNIGGDLSKAKEIQAQYEKQQAEMMESYATQLQAIEVKYKQWRLLDED